MYSPWLPLHSKGRVEELLQKHHSLQNLKYLLSGSLQKSLLAPDLHGEDQFILDQIWEWLYWEESKHTLRLYSLWTLEKWQDERRVLEWI